MAEQKPNRKSSRHFNLDKPGGRRFDTVKDAPDENAVIDTPVDEPVVNPTPDDPTSGSDKKKSGIIWVIVALILAALIAYFGFRSCTNDHESASDDMTKVDEPAKDDDEFYPYEHDEGVQNTDEQGVTTEEEVEVVEEEIPANEPLQQPAPEQPAPAQQPASSPAQTTQQPAPAQQPAAKPAQKASTTTIPTPASTATTVEAQALEVIKGIFGNAPERYQRMKAAGITDPAAVQRLVNQMKREGKF